MTFATMICQKRGATYCAEDSPAKTSPTQPIIDKDYEGSGQVFGGKCFALLSEESHPLFSSKMYLHSEEWDSESFCEICPASGTMQNGRLYERRSSDIPTKDLGYSLLPTPTASSGGQEAIMKQEFVWILDGNLMPRRYSAKADGSFSAGLSRLTKLWVFLPLIPQLAEGLMGFPIDWTDCGDVETQ